MPLFTSSQEKRLWLYALAVLIAIFSTLALGRPLQEMLRDQNTQAVFFLIAMILIGTTITVHGLKARPSKTELVIWFGLAAVYIMFVFRLGAPERSHLMEYSVLAIFIHKALIERTKHENQVTKPALLAFVATVIIGVLDECIQIFLPDRVFDPQDMLFNGLAALTAIGVSMLLKWARKKFRKNN
ncbi:VanZ family protein [Fulvivirgaceae bacterium BMA10]|uniref:VanZ family protein n=1 Tax=Splendidivirga corallicola TaxID=3051826 RepID=A0ABT8KPU0_9BACT|nr:VanZ family protein [Fulvivirgaceae bacterium BMA10]